MPIYDNRQLKVANVKNFGAKGDSYLSLGTDDTEAFQAAKDALLSGEFGILYIPRGRYRITETIDFEQLRDFCIIGDGAGYLNSIYNNSFPQNDSTIIWDGSSGGTVISISGAGFYFNQFRIWGRFPGASTRAGKGVHLYDQPGVGSGNSFIGSINILECDSGWYCGDNPTASNAAALIFSRFGASNCENGFHVTNNQGVEYVFNQIQVGGQTGNTTTNGLKFEAGGDLYVGEIGGAYIDNILSISGTPTDISTNNGFYRVGFIRIDSNQDVTTKIVNCEGTTPASSIWIDGLTYNAGVHDIDSTELFSISGNTDCHVKGARGQIKGSLPIASISSTSSIHFEGCRITGGTWTSVSPSFITGSGKWSAKNCMDASTGIVLPNIGNEPLIFSNRKDQQDTLTFDNSLVINWDLGSADNKAVTLTDDVDISLSGTRPGTYNLLMKCDDANERLITWNNTIDGSVPPSLSGTSYSVLQLYFDGSNWHSFA